MVLRSGVSTDFRQFPGMESGENGVIGQKDGLQNTTIQLAQNAVIPLLIMTFLWHLPHSTPLLPEIAASCGPYDRSRTSGQYSPILHFYFVNTSKMRWFRPIVHLFLHNKGYPIHKSLVSKSSFRGVVISLMPFCITNIPKTPVLSAFFVLYYSQSKNPDGN